MPRSQVLAVMDATLLSRLVHTAIPEVLPLVFHRVHVPDEVIREVMKAPGRVRQRIKRLFAEQSDFWVRCTEFDPGVLAILEFKRELDGGECQVIAQAERLGKNGARVVAVIDEQVGARTARDMQIDVSRTGGLVMRLKAAGAPVSMRETLDTLRAHGFHLKESVYTELLEQAGEA